MPRWLCAFAGVALGSSLTWAVALEVSTPAPRDSRLTLAAGRSAAPQTAPVGPVATQRASDSMPPPRGRKPSEIAERALASTVFVRVGATYGAGVILDGSSLVLTCNHVLDETGDDTPIHVESSEGHQLLAKVIERDPALDLALLSIPPLARAAPAMASVKSVSIGDDVFAMGAPKRMAFSLHRGMVSFVGREFDGVRYLQTDLPTNGGSSGGPVLNDRGEIIAIASFVLRDSEGIAFALPIDYAFTRFPERLGHLAQLDR